MKKIFTLIAVLAIACSSAFAITAVKLESKGQWAEYSLSDKVPFSFYDYVGYKVVVGEMEGTFQVTMGSAETTPTEVPWSDTLLDISDAILYSQLATGDNVYADFEAFMAEKNCTGGIKYFNVQCCDADPGSTIEILAVYLITPDGEEVQQTLGGDCWGGGAYTATEIADGDEPEQPEVSGKCITVSAEPMVEVQWETQFFVTWGEENALAAGDLFEYSLDLKADNASDNGGFQTHAAPGAYLHWAGAPAKFTTEWATTTFTTTIAEDSPEIGGYTIAVNLSLDGASNVYYFTNISVKVNGEEMMVNPDCTGEDLSQYLVKVAPDDQIIETPAEYVVDGINSIVAAPVKDNRIFNIWGVQVDENYKGIVISNGKKYIQR